MIVQHQHIDKRLALAHPHHTSVSLEAKAEIGVCMGFDPRHWQNSLRPSKRRSRAPTTNLSISIYLYTLQLDAQNLHHRFLSSNPFGLSPDQL